MKTSILILLYSSILSSAQQIHLELDVKYHTNWYSISTNYTEEIVPLRYYKWKHAHKPRPNEEYPVLPDMIGTNVCTNMVEHIRQVGWLEEHIYVDGKLFKTNQLPHEPIQERTIIK